MKYLKIVIFVLIIMSLLLSGCGKVAIGDQFLPTQTIPPVTQVAPSNTPTPVIATLTPTQPTATLTPTSTVQPTPQSKYFAGAGDIAICGQEGDDQTFNLLKDKIGEGLFFVAGDSSNENGTMYEYQYCFGKTWGQLIPDLRVVPGNHDYYSDPLENYWIYFDGMAGEPGKGWYSFDYGGWHIVMLNSNCGYVGCGPSSEQIAWLKSDLEDNPSQCSMAIWHNPRYNSGIAGNADWLYTFWDASYEAGVDVIINGHDHHYERMEKINPSGELDPEFGMRSFIVGTGGASYYALDQIQPFSEVRITDTFGVIQFELQPASYSWQFINVDGEIMDQGSDTCSPVLPENEPLD